MSIISPSQTFSISSISLSRLLSSYCISFFVENSRLFFFLYLELSLFRSLFTWSLAKLEIGKVYCTVLFELNFVCQIRKNTYQRSQNTLKLQIRQIESGSKLGQLKVLSDTDKISYNKAIWLVCAYVILALIERKKTWRDARKENRLKGLKIGHAFYK